ncbi:MAG: phosphomannomutase [Armatimonadota bacterium]
MIIAELMERSGVGFGTSGARGLVRDMTDAVCYTYTAGFLQYLESTAPAPVVDRRVAIAGDLRPSTLRIMRAAAQAVTDRGYHPVNCGAIPSPAVAFYGFQQRIPTLMITGSHIPDDRNGIKFTTAGGEVLKADEAGMRAQTVAIPECFAADGMLRAPDALGPVDEAACIAFLRRWLDAFPHDFLAGKRIVLYQHSAVGRDLLRDIYTGLGAEVRCLGRSDIFIPVDTEAIRQEDRELAATWAYQHRCDAILSTDGDSDRPLLADETGRWLRGDVAGILCARFCQADVVVTPVSSNSAVERSGWFREVRRTRIGSPYVIEELDRAVRDGARCAIGYEANGGFLTASPVQIGDRQLAPLPTRDAVLVHLAILGLSIRHDKPISQLLAELPQRATASDRLQQFPTAISQPHLDDLLSGGPTAISRLFPALGEVVTVDTTDGIRMTFRSGEIVHLRPSGNAPELRCYTEAATEARANILLHQVIARLESWRD